AIIMFCVVGVYAVNGSVVDVWIAVVMGALGYVLRKLGFETAPIVLGAILAPMIELALRQSLAMSDGQYAIFVSRPISGTLLAFGAALVLLNLVWWLRRGPDWRRRIPLDEQGENLGSVLPSPPSSLSPPRRRPRRRMPIRRGRSASWCPSRRG